MKVQAVIIALIILITMYSASAKIVVTDIECNRQGQVLIDIQKLDDEVVRLGTINLTAKRPRSNQIFHVPGEFRDKQNFNAFIQPQSLPAKDKIRFISEEALFQVTGNYTIQINQSDPVYQTYAVENVSVICPGYDFSCGDINLEIDNCYVQGRHFFAHYSGLSEKFIDSKGLDNVSYIPNYILRGAEIHSDPLPDHEIITYGDEDRYTLRFVAGEVPGNIQGIGMEISQCDDRLYSTFAYLKCEEAPKCFTNDDCFGDAFCDADGLCKFLECNACQKVINHQCIEKCVSDDVCVQTSSCNEATGQCFFEKVEGCCTADDQCADQLACTTDVCEDNRCVHSQLECPDGDCQEPFGCIERHKEEPVSKVVIVEQENVFVLPAVILGISIIIAIFVHHYFRKK